jgi:hypothetical protein
MYCLPLVWDLRITQKYFDQNNNTGKCRINMKVWNEKTLTN